MHAPDSSAASCPCCGGTTFRTLSLAPMLSIGRCRVCGFMTGEFEVAGAEGSGYDRIDTRAYDRSIAAMRSAEAPDLISAVAVLNPSPKTWLDIGCGAGRLLGAVQRDGYRGFGIEPDAQARAMACSSAPGATISAALSELALQNGSAGVVSMLDVLEHVPVEKLGQTVDELRSLLSPRGVLLLKVPSSDGLFFGVAHALFRLLPKLAAPAIERLWLLKMPSPHYTYFNLRNISLLLERHGFSVVASRYFPTVPLRTAVDRLALDRSISRWKAVLLLPAIAALGVVERLRGITDSLVVIARA